MKTKNSNAAPRNKTPGVIRYCNYFIELNNEVIRADYTHIAGGLHAWIKNTAIWRANADLAMKLVRKGEAHWKDHNGVTHRMVVSDTPCERVGGKNIRRRSAVELVR